MNLLTKNRLTNNQIIKDKSQSNAQPINFQALQAHSRRPQLIGGESKRSLSFRHQVLTTQIPTFTLEQNNKSVYHDALTRYQSQLETVLNDVDCIEIGTTNVCNRKCVSCPVGTSEIGNKLTADTITDDNFQKILTNLSVFKDRAFSLSLHEYNEPLKDEEILQKYQKAASLFPKATLTLFTNGDMLHHSKKGFYSIDKLLAVGIRHIRISIYDSSPLKSKVFERIAINMADFDQSQKPIKQRSEYTHHLIHQGESVIIRVLFLSTQKLSNRGGIIISDKSRAREGICSLPRRTLSIDYLGNLKMCCNVHHAEAGANTWMHGSLLKTPINQILMGESYANMRHKTSMGDYRDLSKCQVCDFYQKSSDRLINAVTKDEKQDELDLIY